jgi:dynein heavy chain, axonemal
LYADKELEDITNACKAECMQKGLQPNKMNIFSTYISRVKKNIHIIICMSPMSDSFATRLRMFPSLITCCTLDWFCEWPEEALLGVGKGQIMDEAAKKGIEDQVPLLCEMFKRIHKSVEKTSIKFKEELRRVSHVTPKSFLEQLMIYKMVLDFKVTEMKNSIQRLRHGLDKLEQANTEVDNMQVMLKEKQPQLEKASIETDQMLAIITVDKKNADEKQVVVA